MVELNRHVDLNKTLHVRIQQMFEGQRVWGGEGVIHVPNAGDHRALATMLSSATTMNGRWYENIANDLKNTKSLVNASAHVVMQHAINDYQNKINAHTEITQQQSEKIIFIDKNQKANWAYLIKFAAAPHKVRGLPARPAYIINATTNEIYKSWDEIRTLEDAKGGGSGGNKKTGKYTYDDNKGKSFPALNIQRDAASQTCYLKNADVTVYDMRKKEAVVEYKCSAIDTTHKVYWNGEHDAINGAFSPANDAFHEGAVIKELYKNWYDLDVLSEDGKPLMLNMYVHENMENAYWDPDTKRMVFGDGDGFIFFYPLTSLDVAAHEISHGFTSQNSNLNYEGQSGGMNESFSDMAAQAAYYYSTGKNNWMIGSDITLWLVGDALRYMDIPSKDCTQGKTQGKDCSIDDADQYNDKVDVHFSSGVYNRMFYLLANSKGWNTRKAFDVMVKANQDYWTATTTFTEGACGVMKATTDLKYDTNDVKKVFMKVGLETANC